MVNRIEVPDDLLYLVEKRSGEERRREKEADPPAEAPPEDEAPAPPSGQERRFRTRRSE
ncbi:hypothetical protein Mal64_24110 [Pseudobythopirellula maris]|uniref:Uncharacterized protein n=1 Tax=Pseudobythopirellula maris TaxID=2527991 RepID=A0A5C5ZQ33_9BACT|nr:hypothetical protein [Pseudobythopirellula maris]TWT88921.1 hypothetical protein Mal64_24110 [Pseudobythopirellula maris]